MVKKDVKIGSSYIMNHTSGKIEIKILREKAAKLYGCRSGTRTMTHWIALNKRTGREIEVKSAAKLLVEV